MTPDASVGFLRNHHLQDGSSVPRIDGFDNPPPLPAATAGESINRCQVIEKAPGIPI